MDLPLWLQENNPGFQKPKLNPELDPGKSGIAKFRPRRKRGFIQKTLEEIVRVLRDSFFSEELAMRPGFLQSLDPRVKILALVVLLLSNNLISHLGVLWGSYLVLLALAAWSGVGLGPLLKRVWLVVPLFSGIMVLPAIFNWVRPGDPLFTIFTADQPWHVGFLHFPAVLAVTKQGVNGAVLLVSRVGISVTLAFIVTLTTRWTDLLKALRSFFVPRIFVTTLEMTYRYIFVLITILEEMFLARKARDAGRSSTSEQRRFIASAMASLFARSLHMSEEVYAAMTARGYSGEVYTMHRFRLRLPDLFFALFVLLTSLTFYVADKVLR